MNNKTYKIYYIHPQLGEIVTALVRGKNEAIKKLSKLNAKENKYKMGEF